MSAPNFILGSREECAVEPLFDRHTLAAEELESGVKHDLIEHRRA